MVLYPNTLLYMMRAMNQRPMIDENRKNKIECQIR